MAIRFHAQVLRLLRADDGQVQRFAGGGIYQTRQVEPLLHRLAVHILNHVATFESGGAGQTPGRHLGEKNAAGITAHTHGGKLLANERSGSRSQPAMNRGGLISR